MSPARRHWAIWKTSLKRRGGKTIVIEDKYRKSSGAIRLRVREKDSNDPAQAKGKAKAREALHQAISTVLVSNNRTAGLSDLKSLVQAGGTCDALFIPDTTQLTSEVLRKLFQNNGVPQASLPRYGSGNQLASNATVAMPTGSEQRRGSPGHVTDRTLTPEEYLPVPGTLGNLPTPKEIADKARNGGIETASSDPQFSAIFVKDVERMNKSGAYSLENRDGSASTCPTLAAFAEFVGPGDGAGFKNGANLVTVVSYLTSQNLPVFLNQTIFKSANTPVRSASGEPIFFNANLKSTYHLKKWRTADSCSLIKESAGLRPSVDLLLTTHLSLR